LSEASDVDTTASRNWALPNVQVPFFGVTTCGAHHQSLDA
jgi:hypothetical protein